MPSLYDLISNPDYIPNQSVGQPAYTAGYDAYTPNDLPLIGSDKRAVLRRRFIENLIPSSLNVRNRGLLETLKLSNMDLGNAFAAPGVGRAARDLYFGNRATLEDFARRGLGGSGLEADALMRNKEDYGRSVLEAERLGSESEATRQLNLMQQLYGVSQQDLQFLTNLQAGEAGQLRNTTGGSAGLGLAAGGVAAANQLYQPLSDLVKSAYNYFNTPSSAGGANAVTTSPGSKLYGSNNITY